MRARQIERERHVEAFVLELARDTCNCEERRDEHDCEAAGRSKEADLETDAFGDRDLAHEEARGEQHGDDDRSEHRQARAPRLEDGVACDRRDPASHRARVLFDEARSITKALSTNAWLENG